MIFTTVCRKNTQHRRSVAASLVQGVYVLKRDRQGERIDQQALAPPWWEFFHFKLRCPLKDEADYSIFGAIYEVEPSAFHCSHSLNGGPRYVVARRGTLKKRGSLLRDTELNFNFFLQRLHRKSRPETAIQAVRDMVAEAGDSNVWLAGHSLGSAMAMLAGKNMAKTGVFLTSFLFNPPFISAPVERIKDENLKHAIRIASSVITAGLTMALEEEDSQQRGQSFAALSAWIPCLFVNPADDICSEYIGYFEQRRKMDEIGACAGAIERLATQNSFVGLFRKAIGRESELVHLIPSANLTINETPSGGFKEAHGIQQWWRDYLKLQSKLYNYT